jgi:hypothetical protein
MHKLQLYSLLIYKVSFLVPNFLLICMYLYGKRVEGADCDRWPSVLKATFVYQFPRLCLNTGGYSFSVISHNFGRLVFQVRRGIVTLRYTMTIINYVLVSMIISPLFVVCCEN